MLGAPRASDAGDEAGDHGGEAEAEPPPRAASPGHRAVLGEDRAVLPAAEVARAQAALGLEDQPLRFLACHLGQVVDVLVAASAVTDARVALHLLPALLARRCDPHVVEDREVSPGGRCHEVAPRLVSLVAIRHRHRDTHRGKTFQLAAYCRVAAYHPGRRAPARATERHAPDAHRVGRVRSIVAELSGANAERAPSTPLRAPAWSRPSRARAPRARGRPGPACRGCGSRPRPDRRRPSLPRASGSCRR